MICAVLCWLVALPFWEQQKFNLLQTFIFFTFFPKLTLSVTLGFTNTAHHSLDKSAVEGVNVGEPEHKEKCSTELTQLLLCYCSPYHAALTVLSMADIKKVELSLSDAPESLCMLF